MIPLLDFLHGPVACACLSIVMHESARGFVKIPERITLIERERQIGSNDPPWGNAWNSLNTESPAQDRTAISSAFTL